MMTLRFDLHLSNLRTFEQASLPVSGLRVLIGDNGAGKSTVLEAFEILRRAANGNFVRDLQTLHGGYHLLARDRAQSFTIAVKVTSPSAPSDWLKYSLTLRQAPGGLGTQLVRETADLGPRPGHSDPLRLLQFDERGAKFYHANKLENFGFAGQTTILSFVRQGQIEGTHPQLKVLADRLANIRVYLGWEVLAAWAAKATQRKSNLRSAQGLIAAQEVEPLGDNLVSVLHEMKNSSPNIWSDYLETVRRGLDLPVDNVNIKLGAEGGTAAIALKLAGVVAELPAASLSDGQLAWLAWSTLLHSPSRPSLLALDEPDLHLHPALAARFMLELQRYAETTPVLVVTHSDALLDSLEKPAEQALLLALDAQMTAQVGTLEQKALAKWLEQYRGIGELRRQGMLQMLTVDAEAGTDQ